MTRSYFDTIRDKCRARPGRVAFPESLDYRIHAAAYQLVSEGSVSQVHLIGDEAEILSAARSNGVQLDAVRDHLRFTQPQDYSQDIISTVRKQLAKKGRPAASPEQEASWCTNPHAVSALLLSQGKVDTTITGCVATTAEVIRCGLMFVGLRQGCKTVSGSFILLGPEGQSLSPLMFADSGVVIDPSVDQLIDITYETIQTWTACNPDEEPRVAFLSFSTHGSASHPSSDKMREAAQAFRRKHPNVLADGELQFDAAISPEILARKAPNSPLKEGANIFIFPDLGAGNIAYKIMQRIGGYHAIGPILQGLQLPFSDLSRGSTVTDIIASTYCNLLRSKVDFSSSLA